MTEQQKKIILADDSSEFTYEIMAAVGAILCFN